MAQPIKKNNSEQRRKIAMIIAFREFRDEEYFIPKNNLIRAGFSIDTVSTSTGQAIGVGGNDAQVNVLVENLNVQDYDAVLFIGGAGAVKYINDDKFHRVAQETVKAGRVLGAICIAPTILAKAGVLKGKKATVWSGPMEKKTIKILEQEGADYQEESVVVDGKIITANGPMAASQWAEKIIRVLGG